MDHVDILAALGALGRSCLGLVFVTAALGKVREGRALQGVVANYRLAPRTWVPPIARVLPWTELAVGGGLLLSLALPSLAAATALAASALLLVFAWAMAVNLRRGRRHIDCGCGHAGSAQRLGWPLVGRNLVLATLLTPSLAAAPPSATLGVVGVGGGVAVFLIYLLFNTLVSLPAIHRYQV